MADDQCEDIDTLAALLDDEEETTPEEPKKPVENESDILKKKLEEMERQMMSLKEELKKKNQPALKDVGLNFSPSTLQPKNPEPKKNSPEASEVHQGDPLDSDEDTENPLANEYNEFGQFVKQRLAHQAASKHQATVDRLKGRNVPEGWKNKSGALINLSKEVGAKSEAPDNGFTDPFFGIRIINPLVSSVTLQQRMEGRKQIKLSQIKVHMRGGDIQDDWVTMGTVIFKSEPRTSQKGKKYAIWKLSDLKDLTKTVSFFLFGDVFTTHWKMAIGSVVGILNPNFMKENNGEDISFTVDHHQKVLHVGSARDLGWCKAHKKDGARCTSVVNKSECEFCVYHIKNEFKKTSAKRAEIQSSFSGSGVTAGDRLRQKVLGKQEVFYGGKIFSGKVVAPPAAKAKDNKILESLKLQSQAMQLKEEEEQQAKKDKNEFAQRLLNPTAGSRNLLRCMASKVPGTSSPAASPAPAPVVKSITAAQLLQQHKMELLKMKNSKVSPKAAPQLGRGLADEVEIDLSEPVKTPSRLSSSSPSNPRAASAKLKALRLIQAKGPLKASDPNNPIQKPTTPKLQEQVRKRVLDASTDGSSDPEHPSDEVLTPAKKKSKADLDAILEAKSSHAHLVDDLELQQSHDYFNKMEKKEMLEEKMLNTYEIKTTAVSCIKCKYTALSASELCRREGHPLRSIKAVKRFFQCKDCKQRTISLDRLPKRGCTHCGGSNWERAAMAKERKGPVLPHEELLLRGEEIKNLNS